MAEPLLHEGLDIVNKQIKNSFRMHGLRHWLHSMRASHAMGTDTAVDVSDAIRNQLSADAVYSLLMLGNFNVECVLDIRENDEAGVVRLPIATPLYAAVQLRDTESIRLLLCFRADVEGYQGFEHPCAVVTPLFEAVRTRNAQALALLLEAQADPNRIGYDWDFARLGLDTAHLVGQTPHALSMTCLWYAVSKVSGNPLWDMRHHVVLLMRFRADPRKPGKIEYRLLDDTESDASGDGDSHFVEALDSGTSPLDIARQALLGRASQQLWTLLHPFGHDNDG